MSLVRRWRRFVAFNAVGLVTTAVGIPFMALLDFAGVPYGVYTGLNYLVGIALGFWLNFQFTFAEKTPVFGPCLVRYLLGFLVLLLLVQGLQWVLIDGVGGPRWLGVGTGMAVYAGLGYLVTEMWVFRRATT